VVYFRNSPKKNSDFTKKVCPKISVLFKKSELSNNKKNISAKMSKTLICEIKTKVSKLYLIILGFSTNILDKR